MMAGLLEYLRDGRDWYICEGIMVFVHLLASVLVVFIHAINYEVPYGRYHKPGSLLYTINSMLTLSPRTAWLIQELPSVVIPLFCLLNVGGDQVGEFNPNIILLGMFLMHYIQRTFIYAALINSGSKPSPFLMVAFAFVFCASNGYLQSRALTHFYYYDISWLWSPQFIIGHVLFLAGMAINLHSDSILRSLRKPGETGYKIPRGGLFEYVSGANYFGETVEWIGFAIACWNLPAAMFALLTASMIGTRAMGHHKYYLMKMEDYPKDRKAFIPFIL